jgi:hypothetical protein
VSISADGTVIGAASENGKQLYIFQFTQEKDESIGLDQSYLIAVCKRAGFFSFAVAIKCMNHSACNNFFAISTNTGEICLFDLRASLSRKGQRTNEVIKNDPLDPIIRLDEAKLGLTSSMKTSETDGNLTIPSVSFGKVDKNQIELNIFTSLG